MPTDAAIPVEAAPPPAARRRSSHGREVIYRHSLIVRVTHWINVIAVTLLVMSGAQIFNAHPRLYFGPYGADADKPWLEMTALKADTGHPRGVLRVAGRQFDTTGVLGVSRAKDGSFIQRGFPSWITLPSFQDLATGRRWHFFLAWVLAINGALYLLAGVLSGHFRRDLAPTRAQLRPKSILNDIIDHLRLRHPVGEEAKRYNFLQKAAYLGVVFVFLPGMVVTGLAMSPGVDAFAPGLVTLLGGRPTARSLHFICANLVVLFIVVHVVEVFIAGVFNEVGSMITGRYTIRTEARP